MPVLVLSCYSLHLNLVSKSRAHYYVVAMHQVGSFILQHHSYESKRTTTVSLTLSLDFCLGYYYYYYYYYYY